MKKAERRKQKIFKNNCGNCIHAKVCSYKDAYDSVVSRIIHEAQADTYLIEVLCKCKYHSEQMGCQPKPDRTSGYQPVKKSTTLTSPPTTGSKVVEPKSRKLNDIITISYEDLRNYIQEEKSEAIKEFAEKMKNKIKTECNPYGKPTFDYDTSISIIHYIDNLVKEIVNDKE